MKEAYVNFRLTDNINITPGAVVVFNPEGFSGNNTAAVGAIRTSFTF
jgi:carbohydrate-selective porin OprB